MMVMHALDSCLPTAGCVSTDIICNDNNYCMDDSCETTVGCVYTTTFATMITALSIHVITLLAALTLPYAATFDYCVPHAVDASTTPPNASLLINVRALLLMQSKDDVNTNLWIVMMIMCACMIAVIHLLDVATLTVCNDHKYSGCL